MKTVKRTLLAAILLIAGNHATATAQNATITPAPIVIPAPSLVQTVTPVNFTIPAAQVPGFVAALFTSIGSTGATMPTLPEGITLSGITARVLPNGSAQVFATFSKK